jgi:hypothetical protein
MRKSIVAAAAIAVVVSIGAPTKIAAAMPVVTPSQLGLAGGAVDSVEKTVLICGPWGCYWRPYYSGWYRPYPYPYPYWGWRRHYWWGWQRHWHRW